MSVCFNCGAAAQYDHHVVPRSLGGVATVPLCGLCHDKAHNVSKHGDVRHLTALALRDKRDKGEAYGTTPYGYSREGTALRPHRAELATVARIRELSADGASLSGIARRLNADAVPTKRGGRWYASTVRYLLRNDLYTLAAES